MKFAFVFALLLLLLGFATTTSAKTSSEEYPNCEPDYYGEKCRT